MKVKLLFSICFICCLVEKSFSRHLILDRVTRMERQDQNVKVGDTVEIGWQYDIDLRTRQEKLDIFYCGYKDKISEYTPFPKLSKNYLLKQNFLDKSIDVFELLILILVNAENFMSLRQVDHGKQDVLSRYKLLYNFHVTMSRLVFMKTVTFKML